MHRPRKIAMSSLASMNTLLILSLAACATARAQSPRSAAPGEPGPLPVREVTVFKDGHAFVLREGDLRPDADGRVVLDRLPVPVLGTFWPYATGGARLVSVTAAKQVVPVEKTALDVRQTIEANVGKDAEILDASGNTIRGTIVAIPARDATEVARLDPRTGGPRAPEKGSVVLLRTAAGTKALPFDQVKNVTILGEAAPRFVEEELRDRLTLRVERKGTDAARVGVVYVQKGLRWIPAYKIDIDGQGHAHVRLEATLVNDLIDLDDATVHLVIGVPRFEFSSMVDPISLQEVAAEVAARMGDRNRFSNYLSNAIQSQSAAYVDSGEAAAARPPSTPELTGGESNEDLFVFTIEHVSLREGERMVLPVTDFELGYRDVYTLDVPIVPPMDLPIQWQGERTAELARLLAAPKAVHALRITNGSKAPLTTAPALLSRNGRVLSQSLLTYTAIGAETDVPLTTAVDVLVLKTEKETGRQLNAVKWNGINLARTDLAGTVSLTNRKKEGIEIEVKWTVLGLADAAASKGTFEQMSLTELWGRTGRADWWSWWSWPYWWHHWNGVARFAWKLHLEPGGTAALDAQWHSFWE
jgi:hypothetical protein